MSNITNPREGIINSNHTPANPPPQLPAPAEAEKTDQVALDMIEITPPEASAQGADAADANQGINKRVFIWLEKHAIDQAYKEGERQYPLPKNSDDAHLRNLSKYIVKVLIDGSMKQEKEDAWAEAIHKGLFNFIFNTAIGVAVPQAAPYILMSIKYGELADAMCSDRSQGSNGYRPSWFINYFLGDGFSIFTPIETCKTAYKAKEWIHKKTYEQSLECARREAINFAQEQLSEENLRLRVKDDIVRGGKAVGGAVLNLYEQGKQVWYSRSKAEKEILSCNVALTQEIEGCAREAGELAKKTVQVFVQNERTIVEGQDNIVGKVGEVLGEAVDNTKRALQEILHTPFVQSTLAGIAFNPYMQAEIKRVTANNPEAQTVTIPVPINSTQSGDIDLAQTRRLLAEAVSKPQEDNHIFGPWQPNFDFLLNPEGKIDSCQVVFTKTGPIDNQHAENANIGGTSPVSVSSKSGSSKPATIVMGNFTQPHPIYTHVNIGFSPDPKLCFEVKLTIPIFVPSIDPWSVTINIGSAVYTLFTYFSEVKLAKEATKIHGNVKTVHEAVLAAESDFTQKNNKLFACMKDRPVCPTNPTPEQNVAHIAQHGAWLAKVKPLADDATAAATVHLQLLEKYHGITGHDARKSHRHSLMNPFLHEISPQIKATASDFRDKVVPELTSLCQSIDSELQRIPELAIDARRDVVRDVLQSHENIINFHYQQLTATSVNEAGVPPPSANINFNRLREIAFTGGLNPTDAAVWEFLVQLATNPNESKESIYNAWLHANERNVDAFLIVWTNYTSFEPVYDYKNKTVTYKLPGNGEIVNTYKGPGEITGRKIRLGDPLPESDFHKRLSKIFGERPHLQAPYEELLKSYEQAGGLIRSHNLSPELSLMLTMLVKISGNITKSENSPEDQLLQKRLYNVIEGFVITDNLSVPVDERNDVLSELVNVLSQNSDPGLREATGDVYRSLVVKNVQLLAHRGDWGNCAKSIKNWIIAARTSDQIPRDSELVSEMVQKFYMATYKDLIKSNVGIDFLEALINDNSLSEKPYSIEELNQIKRLHEELIALRSNKVQGVFLDYQGAALLCDIVGLLVQEGLSRKWRDRQWVQVSRDGVSLVLHPTLVRKWLPGALHTNLVRNFFPLYSSPLYQEELVGKLQRESSYLEWISLAPIIGSLFHKGCIGIFARHPSIGVHKFFWYVAKGSRGLGRLQTGFNCYQSGSTLFNGNAGYGGKALAVVSMASSAPVIARDVNDFFFSKSIIVLTEYPRIEVALTALSSSRYLLALNAVNIGHRVNNWWHDYTVHYSKDEKKEESNINNYVKAIAAAVFLMWHGYWAYDEANINRLIDKVLDNDGNSGSKQDALEELGHSRLNKKVIELLRQYTEVAPLLRTDGPFEAELMERADEIVAAAKDNATQNERMSCLAMQLQFEQVNYCMRTSRCDLAVKVENDHPEMACLHARAYEGMKEPEFSMAKECLSNALRALRTQKNTLYDNGAPQDDILKLEARIREVEYEELLLECRELIHNNKLADAEKMILIKIAKDQPEYYVLLAEICLKQKPQDLARARESFLSAIKVYNAILKKVVARWDSQDIKARIKQTIEKLEKDIESITISLDLQVCEQLITEGKLDNAECELNKIKKHPEAYVLLYAVCMKRTPPQRDKGVEYLKSAVKAYDELGKEDSVIKRVGVLKDYIRQYEFEDLFRSINLEAAEQKLYEFSQISNEFYPYVLNFFNVCFGENSAQAKSFFERIPVVNRSSGSSE